MVVLGATPIWNYLIVLCVIVTVINVAALFVLIAGAVYQWWLSRYEVTHVRPDLTLTLVDPGDLPGDFESWDRED